MSAWTVVTADVTVTSQPALLYGLVVLASSAGGDVTLYAGKDTGGRKIGTFKGAQNVSNPIPFWPPLPCPNGIYADVGSSITEVLIHWDPAEC